MPIAARGDTEKANGPRSRKGVQTRARLLEAAKRVFEEDGFLEARISDIADRAGLSHGSFYHYFESKEEIFREVAAEVEERLSAPMDSVILDPSSVAPPRDRIREALRRHLESYRDEAKIMGVIEQVSRYDDEVRAARSVQHQHYRDEVTESIRQLQRHGLVDPNLDPEVASVALGAMTSRFPELWLSQGLFDCSFDAAVDQLSRLFANALQLDDDSPPRRQGRPRTK